MRRWLRILGIPLAGLLVFSFFLIRGFPYDLLGDRLADALGANLGAEVTITDLGPVLRLAGPALEAGAVQVVFDDGLVLSLDRALARPAWSLSWLRLRPAVYTELQGPLGEIAGTYVHGGDGSSAWDGRLREIDLGQLPFALVPGVGLSGRADAEVDLALGPAGPEGTATFLAREGAITLPEVPMPVPFDVCKGNLRFGGDALLSVQKFDLEGPLISASATGTVAKAPDFTNAPLALDVEINAQPAIRAVLQSSGLRIGRDGSARLRVTGTPAAPVVR